MLLLAIFAKVCDWAPDYPQVWEITYVRYTMFKEVQLVGFLLNLGREKCTPPMTPRMDDAGCTVGFLRKKWRAWAVNLFWANDLTVLKKKKA